MDAAAPSDAKDASDLANRIKAGDQRADAELIERYRRGVRFVIAREVKNSADAEDLSQDCFRIALEKIRRGELREPEKLSGFMCGVARNLVNDYLRQARSRQSKLTQIDEAAPIQDSAPGPLDQLSQKEKGQLVRQVISELPVDRDRELIFRFYIAEQEKEEICADLGLDRLHFNRVLFRARERYKQLYEKRCGRE